MKSAISYIRVSTNKQGESGQGASAQLAAIQKFAKLNNYRLIRKFSDVGSGMGEATFSQRPGALGAIDFSRKRGCPIIVASADRFSRNVDAARLHSSGLTLIAADLGAGATSDIFQVEIARAERAGELIRQSTKEGLKRARAAGKTFGNPRLSEARQRAHETNRRLGQLRREEFARELLWAQNNGAKTAEEIALEFKERGFPTPRGRQWKAGDIRNSMARLKTNEIRQRKLQPPVLGQESDLLRRFREALIARNERSEVIVTAMEKIQGRALSRAAIQRLETWIITAAV